MPWMRSPALALPQSLRGTPWLARLALAVALGFCIWQLVNLLWLVLAGPDAPAGTVPAGVLADATPASAGQLSKWHLFGDAQGGNVDLAALAQSRLQETALKLTLRGTFNESRPEGGVAIIADEAGVDRSYRVGDTLPGDAKLEEILAGVVVLSRAGVRETLSLRLIDGNSASASSARPAPAPASTLRAPTLPGSPQAGMAPIQIKPAIAPGGPDMQSWRAANLPNVEDLAKQVQLFPVFDNGRMRGVRLSAGRDSDILERAGLKPSDIITSVNGVPLDGPARQAELLMRLRDAKQVQLDVQRDGKTIKLQFGP